MTQTPRELQRPTGQSHSSRSTRQTIFETLMIMFFLLFLASLLFFSLGMVRGYALHDQFLHSEFAAQLRDNLDLQTGARDFDQISSNVLAAHPPTELVLREFQPYGVYLFVLPLLLYLWAGLLAKRMERAILEIEPSDMDHINDLPPS